MKFFTRLSIALVSIVCIFASCAKDIASNEMVDVRINLAGLNISTNPIDSKNSDQDANGAYVKRIVLSIYDLSGNLIQTYTQNKDTDPTSFGQTITARIPVGSYKFVAVAHNVANTSDAAATINSATAVSFGTQSKLNPTYTRVQDVTIAGNTTQSVTIDFGTRRNALFYVHITDATPSNVQKLQFIANPTGSDYTDLVANPSTGFAAAAWRYSKVYDLSAISQGTFSGINIGLPLLLTASSQTMDVTINALDANSQVLYTRTLSNVTLQQTHQTIATGTFFSPMTSTSFVFDVSLITDNISLD